MAARDIMPFTSPHGTPKVQWGKLAAGGCAVDIGEPLRFNAGGELVDTADPVADINNFAGIACTNANTSSTNGTFRQLYGNFSVASGGPAGNPTAGDLVGFWVPDPSVLWITYYFGTSTGVFGGTKAATIIGDVCAVITDGTNWGLNSADDSGANIIARVVDVLDSQYIPIGYSGRTGVYVVFTLSPGQVGSQPITTAPADPGA